MNSPQVEREHYTFECYCYPERWASYYYQIREILNSEPHSVLEVGAGDGAVRDYVMRFSGIRYHTVDIAEDLKPDMLGDITALPVADKSYDTVCTFEVLEHIPFDIVSAALSELSRVAKKSVLISIPHFGPPISFSLKLPLLPAISFFCKIPYPKTHTFNGQHYWEMGKRGYSQKKIRTLLQQRFTIEREFIPPDAPYHHFFVLTPL